MPLIDKLKTLRNAIFALIGITIFFAAFQLHRQRLPGKKGLVDEATSHSQSGCLYKGRSYQPDTAFYSETNCELCFCFSNDHVTCSKEKCSSEGQNASTSQQDQGCELCKTLRFARDTSQP